MKTIGLLGGMSWESTASYYEAINEGVKRELGGLHSARICLVSVDFEEVKQLQYENRWEEATALLSSAAQSVEAGGADFLLICTNTMHKLAPEIAAAISIPLVHIADATGGRLRADGIGTVGLLGTRFTMEQDFYTGRLAAEFGLQVVVPDAPDRQRVHDIIYDELCLGRVEDSSRRAYLEIIDRLAGQGADAVILGCTEIALLVQQHHTGVPLYDTAQIHADEAVRLALGGARSD